MNKALEHFQQIIAGNRPAPLVANLSGFQPVEVKPGFAAFQLDVDEKYANPMGTLHGGILAVLADTAMGSAYMTLLEDGESLTTVEMKINYFKPVWKARLTARATVIKKGKTLGYIECDVHDEQQNLIARASSTCMTLTGKAAEGR